MFDLRRNKNTANEEPEMSVAPESAKSTVMPPTQPAGSQPPVQTTNSTSTRSSTVIGPSVKIQGDIISDEDLVIEGQVEGTITCNAHTVTVGKSGTLKANVSAKDVTVNGSLEGNISGIERVLVTASGVVRGNIVAPRVILEDGARFKGSIDMDADSQVARSVAAAPGKSALDVANPVQSAIGPKPVKNDAAEVSQTDRKSVS